MITFFAMLANANAWVEIEIFVKAKEKWLRKHLELPYGIPNHDIIRLIIGNIESTQFNLLTIKFLISTMDQMLKIGGVSGEETVHDIIAVDGKESKGTKREQRIKQEVVHYRH